MLFETIAFNTSKIWDQNKRNKNIHHRNNHRKRRNNKRNNQCNNKENRPNTPPNLLEQALSSLRHNRPNNLSGTDGRLVTIASKEYLISYYYYPTTNWIRFRYRLKVLGRWFVSHFRWPDERGKEVQSCWSDCITVAEKNAIDGGSWRRSVRVPVGTKAFSPKNFFKRVRFEIECFLLFLFSSFLFFFVALSFILFLNFLINQILVWNLLFFWIPII
jgi:hypothetical protein